MSEVRKYKTYDYMQLYQGCHSCFEIPIRLEIDYMFYTPPEGL